MQNAKVQGNTKLCIFAFNFSPVPILPRENLAYANIIWKANYFLESKLKEQNASLCLPLKVWLAAIPGSHVRLFPREPSRLPVNNPTSLPEDIKKTKYNTK